MRQLILVLAPLHVIGGAGIFLLGVVSLVAPAAAPGIAGADAAKAMLFGVMLACASSYLLWRTMRPRRKGG